MKQSIAIIFGVVTSAGVLSGCASVPIRGGFSDVQQLVDSRTGLEVHWGQATPEGIEIAYVIDSMLEEELTADAAVQIALLKNRSLQAEFEELGIAQADLVHAGLLRNPVFAASTRFPDASESTNIAFSVAGNFLDVFILPLRKKLAAEQFEQAKLRVGDAVLDLAGEARSAYYTLQGAQQMLAMRKTVVEAAEAAAELARRQREAGNISALDLANQQAIFRQAQVDLAEHEAEVLADRERLSRLMGLSDNERTWTIVGPLPDLPQTEPPLEELEVVAVSQRLDLAAARQQTKILERAVSVTRFGMFSHVEVGVETERELDRTQVTGPILELEVPVFDQHQPEVARAKAQLRQSQQRLAALERTVQSDVRLAPGRLLAARQAVGSYRDTLIPLYENVVALSQQHYNYMLLGVYKLLAAKQDEVVARRDYLGALRDYWIARSDLERTVGGRLTVADVAASEPAPSPEPFAMPSDSHNQHGGET